MIRWLEWAFIAALGRWTTLQNIGKKLFHVTFSKVKPDKSYKKRLLTKVGTAKETSERLYLQKAIEGLPPSSERVAGNHM